MLLKNKAVDYACLAVREIAVRRAQGSKLGIQAGEIARAYNLPTAYAAKVMSILARSRILTSDRGPRGGFRLAKDPAHITMLDIFEAVNGTIDFEADLQMSCLPDTDKQTWVRDAFGTATQAIQDALAKVSVQDVVDTLAKA